AARDERRGTFRRTDLGPAAWRGFFHAPAQKGETRCGLPRYRPGVFPGGTGLLPGPTAAGRGSSTWRCWWYGNTGAGGASCRSRGTPQPRPPHRGTLSPEGTTSPVWTPRPPSVPAGQGRLEAPAHGRAAWASYDGGATPRSPYRIRNGRRIH